MTSLAVVLVVHYVGSTPLLDEWVKRCVLEDGHLRGCEKGLGTLELCVTPIITCVLLWPVFSLSNTITEPVTTTTKQHHHLWILSTITAIAVGLTSLPIAFAFTLVFAMLCGMRICPTLLDKYFTCTWLLTYFLRNQIWDVALSCFLLWLFLVISNLPTTATPTTTTHSLVRIIATVPLAITSCLWFSQHVGITFAQTGMEKPYQYDNMDTQSWAFFATTLVVTWAILPCNTLLLRIVQYYTFYWVWPTIAKRNIDVDDLPPLTSRQHPESLHTMLETLSPTSAVQLLDCVLRRIQPWPFWNTMLHCFTFLICMTVDPILINWLLSDSDAPNKWHDMTLVVVLSASMLVRVSCMEMGFFNSVAVMATARSAVVVSVFKQALESGQHDSSVDLANLMSSDADKIGASGWVVFFLAQWTFALISLPVTVYVLSTFVGTQAALAGVSAVLFGGLISRQLGRLLQPFNVTLQAKRDDRAGLVRDVLDRILSVKLAVGEDDWKQRLDAARQHEMHALIKVRIVSVLNSLMGSLVGILVPISIFAWYTKVNPHRALDPSVAFAALASITQISWSVGTLPAIFDLWGSLKPSGDRLVGFLRFVPASSHDNGDTTTSPNDNVRMIAARIPVGFQRALFDVDLIIPRGCLVLVSGPVGGGKSSLLAVMAGARDVLQGKVILPEKRAYVEQKPFLLNGTLRENVVFAQDVGLWDEEKYRDALTRAQLSHDLALLPKHDLTLVGDKGVQLSGGQRTRVALARALYCDADLYVFDDVLAAVDATTGDALRREMILFLLNMGKTVILSTNHVETMLESHAPLGVIKVTVDQHGIRASDVIVVNDDSARARTPTEIVVATTNNNHHGADDTTTYKSENQATLSEFTTALHASLYQRLGRVLDEDTIMSVEAELTGVTDDDERDATRRDALGGTISWRDAMTYFHMYGAQQFPVLSVWAVLLFVLTTCFFEVASPFWLSHWTESGTDGLLVYCGLSVAQLISAMFLSLIAAACAMGASIRLHHAGISRLLHAPMAVFDGQPAGRLFNVLSSDLRNVDESVPDSALGQFRRTLTAMTQLAVIGFLIPLVLVLLPVLLPMYLWILNQVRSPSRDAKRAEALAHGPVYSLFFDTLRGRETIRAFGREKEFRTFFATRASVMARTKIGSEAISKWAQALATQTGCILYLSCGLLGVWAMFPTTPHDSVSLYHSRLGLLMAYAAILQRTGMDLMMGWTSLETNMVSVERFASLLRVPVEDLGDEGKVTLTGDVVFENVALRYRLYRPLVLDGLSIRIPRGAKVALVGATGAGKSSIVSALLRLYSISRGQICIGSYNVVRDVSLRALRRQVCVVNQDAVLPFDTLRECIGAVNDVEAREALNRVGLVSNRFAYLDLQVMRRGVCELSVGERQLVCVARGICRSSAGGVLFCDECTSAVDIETDGKVLRTVLGLHDVTAICIMHRLAHIAQFDLVAVVDRGRIVEFDHPRTLMSRNEGKLKVLLEAGMMKG